jgi:hypothetical protein
MPSACDLRALQNPHLWDSCRQLLPDPAVFGDFPGGASGTPAS